VITQRFPDAWIGTVGFAARTIAPESVLKVEPAF